MAKPLRQHSSDSRACVGIAQASLCWQLMHLPAVLAGHRLDCCAALPAGVPGAAATRHRRHRLRFQTHHKSAVRPKALSTQAPPSRRLAVVVFLMGCNVCGGACAGSAHLVVLVHLSAEYAECATAAYLVQHQACWARPARRPLVNGPSLSPRGWMHDAGPSVRQYRGAGPRLAAQSFLQYWAALQVALSSRLLAS